MHVALEGVEKSIMFCPARHLTPNTVLLRNLNANMRMAQVHKTIKKFAKNKNDIPTNLGIEERPPLPSFRICFPLTNQCHPYRGTPHYV